MKLLLFALTCASLSALASSREICYGDYGCFIDTYPFGGSKQRPFSLLPDKPEKIDVRFKLFTRTNPSGEPISNKNISSNFDQLRDTKIIVHGFLDPPTKKWIIDMKDALLEVDDLNVIVTDWSRGNGFPYTQSTANTQIVGIEIANLVNALKGSSSDLNKFHVIGHSLGSHIAGYAGARLNGKLGRITGLDVSLLLNEFIFFSDLLNYKLS
jgi:hypothetical protein